MTVKSVALPLLFSQLCAAAGPFFQALSEDSWIIGNDLWNLTQGPVYGKPAYYKGIDIVGLAEGHYVGHDGESNLVYTSAEVVAQGEDFIDVSFNAKEGEVHYVIYSDLSGAYQYFVNHALPVLGEFRTLWRLNNETFPNGRTNIKDEPLPLFSLYGNATKVQDETWQLANGTYITKYDWSDFIRGVDFYGIYGDEVGSWYIRPGEDYLNGNHLKQELFVHRESMTGDAVQLNMLHGTHFTASSADVFPDGKVFGPWLWYLNDGSREDAAARQKQEFAAWPYAWFNDTAYQSRAEIVTGKLVLSDGRPAAGAAVFLGENNSNKTTLDQGALYNYAVYADESGAFNFTNVRAATYALYAWSNGGDILGNVTTALVVNDVSIPAQKSVALEDLGVWEVPEGREQIFQIGAVDRKTLGFAFGGHPYQHALVDQVPANVTFTVGKSDPETDWYFAQSTGTWDVEFELAADAVTQNRSALLTVSLAGFSTGSSAGIYVNGETRVGNLTTNSIPSDPSLYRSANVAGEYHLFEFGVDAGVLKEGSNTVSFVVEKHTQWRGWLWDSIILEWVS